MGGESRARSFPEESRSRFCDKEFRAKAVEEEVGTISAGDGAG